MNEKALRKAVMPTLVVTLIFFINYWLFGMENTIIGPFLTLSFLKFQEMEDYRGCMLRSFGIYSVMAAASFVALLHPLLCLLVNGAALFWIGYFLIDEYHPLNYFPAGMALIFFQISPVSGVQVLKRILALAVSFLAVFLCLWAMRRVRGKKQTAVSLLAGQGLEACEQMMDALRRGGPQKAEELRRELCRVNRKISLKLYEANRSSLKKELEENVFCSYVTCFQMMSCLANQVLEGPEGKGALPSETKAGRNGAATEEDDELRFAQMEALQKEFKERYQKEEKRLEGNRQENQTKEWKGLEGDAWKGRRVMKDRLHFRENPMDLRSFRLRFALRQVLVMTPCLLFGMLSPWENSYWLAISVFFMMVPVYESTAKRVIQRIKGSIFGIVVCLVAFSVFRGFWARVFLMTVANFFIYYSESYTAMVACITCSALALNFGTDSYILMLGMRLLYTLLGAGIAVFANVWVFRIRAFRQCQYVMELLDGLKKQMEEASGRGWEGQQKEMNQMMVKSYLLASRMQEFNDMAKEADRQPQVDEFIKQHMMFMAKASLSSGQICSG